MKKNKIKLLLVIVIIFIVLLERRGGISEIEDKEISAGIGTSTIKLGENDYIYSISDNVYFFIEDKDVTSDVYTGIGDTIGQTREDRATKLPKEFFLGLAKIFITDEGTAKNGIRPSVDILFNNPIINDNAFYVICKGSSSEILKHQVPGFSSPSEYIEGMIRHMENYNFFKEEFKFRNVNLRLDSEGRNIVLPYIELDEKGFKIGGIGLFKKDKLVYMINSNEVKSLNILRNKSGKGMLTIQEDNDYINYYAKSKRKIKCNKEDDKYKFLIELSFSGDIVSNNLYKDIDKKTEAIDKFQKDMEKTIEDMCNKFLYDMKNRYKVDCLELGRVAAAKYGRDTGVDWNEIVCDSEIKVKVKVKVDKVGRGQY